MIKSNPFYALSASAMLLGCWLLSEALELQAGQLQGLLVLMFVLQLYEGLLVGFGAFLVRSKRAPRDGLVVLVIESLFLLDATLLATECVTTDTAVGTFVAVTSAALAVLKLWWVRRAAPDLLTQKAAVILGAHAALILAAPVAAAHLAGARLLGPAVLYGFWWTAAALPVARRILCDETQANSNWTWMPSGLVLLHLWTLGYIHTLDFMPAFLAPFLLGLAVTATSAQLHRQLLLPGIAALCSLGGDPVVTLQLFGDTHAFSPLRCALVGAGIVWVYLGRRDRRPRLVFMGICATAVGLLGSSTRRLAQALRRLFEKALPADAFGWGVLTVVAAFALLAAGVRRSLQGEPRWPGRAPGLKARSRLGESDAASTGGGQ